MLNFNFDAKFASCGFVHPDVAFGLIHYSYYTCTLILNTGSLICWSVHLLSYESQAQILLEAEFLIANGLTLHRAFHWNAVRKSLKPQNKWCLSDLRWMRLVLVHLSVCQDVFSVVLTLVLAIPGSLHLSQFLLSKFIYGHYQYHC